MTNADKVLTAITDHWRTYAIPPSIRAIQDRTGINSTSLIRSYYLRLEQAGLIKRIQSKPVPVAIYKMLTQGEPSQ